VYEHFNKEEEIKNFKHATQIEQALAKELIYSCSENKGVIIVQAIEDTLVTMLHDGISILFISKLLTQIGHKSSLSLSHLIKSALSSMCLVIKEEDKRTSKRDNQSMNLLKLNTLLNSVSDYLQVLDENKVPDKVTNQVKSLNKKKVLVNALELDQNEDTFSHEDVMECMRVFCNDQQIDINLRLLVLEQLKVNFKNMEEKDLLLLLSKFKICFNSYYNVPCMISFKIFCLFIGYKTNAVLKSCQKFNEILLQSSVIISSEAARLELMMKLIHMSKTQEEFDTILSLLKIWPPFKTIEHLHEKPHNLILAKMLKSNMFFVNSVKDLKKNEILTDLDVEFINEQLKTEDDWSKENGWLKIAFLKFAIAYKNEKVLKSFLRYTEIECLKGLNINLEAADGYEINKTALKRSLEDKELILLILEDNTYISLIQTPFYSIFIHYILKNEPKSLIYDVVRNLKENNFLFESSKVFGSVENFCESYKTVSSLLALVENFE